MDKGCYQILGRQFYEWHREGKLIFQYGGQSKDLELEVDRLIGLIDYVEKKHQGLSDQS
ncbi:MAG: hypothetical protein HQL13_04190 [Candidatus Omnitrophica bacterium]|nr:hypothetical protein [Candidatus Omnitrophota bacterium]